MKLKTYIIHRFWFVFITSLLLSACNRERLPEPQFIAVGHHQLIERDDGVNMLVDVCIKYEDIGDTGDHFLGTESRNLATIYATHCREYFTQNNIKVKSTQLLVCGAAHSANNEPQKFLAQEKDPVTLISQPFSVISDFENDKNYISVLSLLSTYVLNFVDKENFFSKSPSSLVSIADFKASALNVGIKTGQGNLLYVGLTGVKESPTLGTTKSVALFLGTAVLMGALGQISANSQPTMLQPDGTIVRSPAPPIVYNNDPKSLYGIQPKQMVAGLVDLKIGELAWSSIIDVKELENPYFMNALLFDITHKLATEWSFPGIPPSLTK